MRATNEKMPAPGWTPEPAIDKTPTKEIVMTIIPRTTDSAKLTRPVTPTEAEEAALHDEMLTNLVDAVNAAEHGPCPGWCGRPTGHPFSRPEVPGDSRSRVHERRFGPVVTVQQWETLEHGIETPTIDVNPDPLGEPMTADEADQLGEDVKAAARFLRLIEDGAQ